LITCTPVIGPRVGSRCCMFYGLPKTNIPVSSKKQLRKWSLQPMKHMDGTFQLTATDLVAHSACDHLMALEKQVALGEVAKPDHYDPLLEILRERGQRHETAYLEHLHTSGMGVTTIDGTQVTNQSVTQTIEAMQAGKQIIAQAALQKGIWSGRADILMRVEKPSALGEWSYEVVDTKLARETKGGTILQLCLYANLLSGIQEVDPEFIHVVAPWSDYEPQTYRFADYAAYFRQIKRAAETDINADDPAETYPDPKSHCDICRWQKQCDQRRRDDDHLCLVANISKAQIVELNANGVATMKALAELPVPIPFEPKRGTKLSFEKSRAQAAIQVSARESGELKYEFLDPIPEAGLGALPEPSDGDVFFDIESDQFVGEHGLEYLFGYAFKNEESDLEYQVEWAFDPDAEKTTFERFVDFLTERRKQFPGMHVYHFAPYEPSALKRLMGRYASRENEIDNLLRGLVFVDLLSVVRHGLRASVESYSLKKLEPFFKFERKVSLHDANVALTRLSSQIELDDFDSVSEETKSVVEVYNADDCYSTAALRDWLEGLRDELISQGHQINRPEAGKETTQEADEQAQRIQELVDRLIDDVPVDENERTNEQHGRWILAHLLEWHRREDKSVWWEYFRLCDLQPDDLLRERTAISGLEFVETIGRSKRGLPTDRYKFVPQDTEVRAGDDLKIAGGDDLGKVEAVSVQDATIDIRKKGATAGIHPEAVFSHLIIRTNEQKAALFRLGEYVAEHGLEGNGPFKAGRSILLRSKVGKAGISLQCDGELALDAALRIAPTLDGDVLAIQGPPGTGKSFTGAHVICDLVEKGKTVGITANSHKVIRNLMDTALKVAVERNIDLKCIQKPGGDSNEQDLPNLTFAKNNQDVFQALSDGRAQVAGATSFLWAREEAQDTLDVLIVDEAAQMALANVIAVSGCAKSLILLGDPQQLEQPTQGSHPDGTDCSALDHLLEGHQTISDDQGLFHGVTYRLHPDICRFNSELFYESKLSSVEKAGNHEIRSNGPYAGSGLLYLPVEHSGNTSSSQEEAEEVVQVVYQILADNTTWVDGEGCERKVTIQDILIIAPYNAQVFEIHQRLPEARVGTVDKFQGQEAPITIFSMATSSYADAPRGMEFLYSPNRLNVAISRAQCMAILVASPSVFQADCKTPRQMQLANAFCRYLEIVDDRPR
jgi:predicted RecB family nuclease